MIKKLLKAFTIAFSIYSKIPMPAFKWNSSDMEGAIAFFPLVGGIIGGLEIGWFTLFKSYALPEILFVCVAVTIPLFVTGGIHIDGFMDTCDALNSYQPRDRKLEILKDPHIGAFSVICLCMYILTAIGCLSAVESFETACILSMNFVLARIFSAFGVITRKKAKENSMLQPFETTKSKWMVITILLIQAVGCLCLGGIADWKKTIVLLVLDGIVYAYYCYKSNREFGGITGDLAGWFLSLCELFGLIVLVGYECVIKML